MDVHRRDLWGAPLAPSAIKLLYWCPPSPRGPFVPEEDRAVAWGAGEGTSGNFSTVGPPQRCPQTPSSGKSHCLVLFLGK